MAKKNTTQLARKALLRRGRALLRLRQEVPDDDGPDFLAGMSEVERHELEEIHAALERIERGIFGRCEECGDKIAAERIERVPYVRDCAACADAPAELEPAVHIG